MHFGQMDASHWFMKFREFIVSISGKYQLVAYLSGIGVRGWTGGFALSLTIVGRLLAGEPKFPPLCEILWVIMEMVGHDPK
jgi:hypothetical protein